MQENSDLKAFNLERSKELYVMHMKKKQSGKLFQDSLLGFIIVMFFVLFSFIMYRNVILNTEVDMLYEALDKAESERDSYWCDINELKLEMEKMKKKRID